MKSGARRLVKRGAGRVMAAAGWEAEPPWTSAPRLDLALGGKDKPGAGASSGPDGTPKD